MSGPANTTSNRSILQKADLALADLLSDGGIMQPAQSKKFMQLMVKKSRLLELCTVKPMASHKEQIDKMRFAGRILRPGTEYTALAALDRTKPDTTQVELDAKLFKAEVRLSNETLEDNIEQDELRQTIMQTMAEGISRDIEEMVIQGDTASGDAFLAVFDGILKQATSNIVDAGSAPLTQTVLRNLLKAMPSEFLRKKSEMAFLTSVDAEIDYRDTLSTRETNLGDDMLANAPVITYAGIPIQDLQLFPEDQGVGNNETSVVFTDPKNICVGMWRDIRVETDKLVSEGALLIVASLRMDAKYIEETAVAKAINVQVAAP